MNLTTPEMISFLSLVNDVFTAWSEKYFKNYPDSYPFPNEKQVLDHIRDVILVNIDKKTGDILPDSVPRGYSNLKSAQLKKIISDFLKAYGYAILGNNVKMALIRQNSRLSLTEKGQQRKLQAVEALEGESPPSTPKPSKSSGGKKKRSTKRKKPLKKRKSARRQH